MAKSLSTLHNSPLEALDGLVFEAGAKFSQSTENLASTADFENGLEGSEHGSETSTIFTSDCQSGGCNTGSCDNLNPECSCNQAPLPYNPYGRVHRIDTVLARSKACETNDLSSDSTLSIGEKESNGLHWWYHYRRLGAFAPGYLQRGVTKSLISYVQSVSSWSETSWDPNRWALTFQKSPCSRVAGLPFPKVQLSYLPQTPSFTRCPSGTPGSSKAPSTRGRARKTSTKGGGRSGRGGGKRTPGRDGTDNNSGDFPSEEHGQVKHEETYQEISEPPLGCILRARYPLIYNAHDFKSCALNSFKTMARLKAHIYEVHCTMICNRCHQPAFCIIEDGRQKEVDEKRHNCTGIPSIGEIQGLDGDKLRLIHPKTKSPDSHTQGDIWREKYAIIFPETRGIPLAFLPSPYFVKIVEVFVDHLVDPISGVDQHHSQIFEKLSIVLLGVDLATIQRALELFNNAARIENQYHQQEQNHHQHHQELAPSYHEQNNQVDEISNPENQFASNPYQHSAHDCVSSVDTMSSIGMSKASSWGGETADSTNTTMASSRQPGLEERSDICRTRYGHVVHDAYEFGEGSSNLHEAQNPFPSNNDNVYTTKFPDGSWGYANNAGSLDDIPMEERPLSPQIDDIPLPEEEFSALLKGKQPQLGHPSSSNAW